MTLNTIIAQITGVVPDSVAAGKLHSVTKAAKAHVDSLTNTITNPDSLMALTPKKVANHLLGLDSQDKSSAWHCASWRPSPSSTLANSSSTRFTLSHAP